jgi:hypothetical protein
MVLGGNRKRYVGIPSVEGRVTAFSAQWRGRLRGFLFFLTQYCTLMSVQSKVKIFIQVIDVPFQT